MKIRFALFFIITLSFFTISCQKYSYTNASPSLVLREDANKESKNIVNIPVAQKIMIIEETEKVEEINGKKGKWIKIKWKTYTGWVFDAYLTKELSIESYKLKDLFDYKIAELGDFYFNGYYTQDSKNEYFANFHVQSSDKIYSSYEAGGAESTVINMKYEEDSLILTVKYEEYADDYLENDNADIIKKEIYDCFVTKEEFIKYINQGNVFDVKCNKK